MLSHSGHPSMIAMSPSAQTPWGPTVPSCKTNANAVKGYRRDLAWLGAVLTKPVAPANDLNWGMWSMLES